MPQYHLTTQIPNQPWPINSSLSRPKPNTVSCQQKTHGWPSVYSGFLTGLTTQKATIDWQYPFGDMSTKTYTATTWHVYQHLVYERLVAGNVGIMYTGVIDWWSMDLGNRFVIYGSGYNNLCLPKYWYFKGHWEILTQHSIKCSIVYL